LNENKKAESKNRLTPPLNQRESGAVGGLFRAAKYQKL
jgi:hypothetical protein